MMLEKIHHKLQTKHNSISHLIPSQHNIYQHQILLCGWHINLYYCSFIESLM